MASVDPHDFKTDRMLKNLQGNTIKGTEESILRISLSILTRIRSLLPKNGYALLLRIRSPVQKRNWKNGHVLKKTKLPAECLQHFS
jgi:hypothetical protein